MNRLRLYLHRIFRRPVVTGPTRIYVRRIPAGVMLDIEDFLTNTLATIADDEDLLALFLEYAADRASATSYDGHGPEALRLEQIFSVTGFETPVYGDAVAALAEQLLAAAPVAPVVPIPGQRREGGAAA
ncbi:hypothetical protein [Streptomyces sp. NPDC004250]|uniref:hypothetical protein n=1 Tax=Streptomyces sp. NPDC004250 TaxID=3364692 RepID=UPI0036973B62